MNCCHSVSQSCLTLCDPTDYSRPGFPVFHQLPDLTQTHAIKSVMSSNHFIVCHSLLLLPSIFPGIKVFPNESVLCIRWTNYWSFIFLPIRNGGVGGRGGCNSFGSVLPQQRFEVRGESVLQLNFIRKNKG